MELAPFEIAETAVLNNEVKTMWQDIAGNAAGTVLKDTVGGGVGRSSATGGTSADYINVAPVGVNLGEILKPYNEGSLRNGGYGLLNPGRYFGTDTKRISTSIGSPASDFPWGLIALLGAGGFLLYKVVF